MKGIISQRGVQTSKGAEVGIAVSIVLNRLSYQIESIKEENGTEKTHFDSSPTNSTIASWLQSYHPAPTGLDNLSASLARARYSSKADGDAPAARSPHKKYSRNFSRYV